MVRKTRERAKKGQEEQIKTMLKRNKKEINSYKINDVVLLRCENVDRGLSDPENIICIITNKKNGLFELGCKVGIIDSYFAINSITKTAFKTDFTIDNIPKEKLSVRSAVSKLSVGHGQGFLRCNCTGDCKTKRCSCRKAEISCNSRCHGPNASGISKK